MKRLAISIFSAAVLALAFIGAASAEVTFDPTTGQGFIGRGDVIAFLGKDGLTTHPVAMWTTDVVVTADCFYTDGSSSRPTGATQTWWLSFPLVRRAPNGTITGYVLPGNLIDGGPPFILESLCYSVADGRTVAHYDVVSWETGETVLLFNGVAIPFTTP